MAYKITSITKKEQFTGTLPEAIERAKAINEEYQPSWGVQVEGEDGETVWDSEDEEGDDA